MIVGDGARNRPPFESDPVNKAFAHAAAGVMAFDHSHFQDVARGVRHDAAIFDFGVYQQSPGRQRMFVAVDHADARPIGGNGEIDTVPLDVDSARQRRDGRRHDLDGQRTVLRNQRPAAVHLLRLRRAQIGEDEQVGAAARRDGSPVVQPEIFGGVERAQPDRGHRVDTVRNRHADHVVNRPHRRAGRRAGGRPSTSKCGGCFPA